jgi:hypothetical protein
MVHPIVYLCSTVVHDDPGAARTGLEQARRMSSGLFDINAPNPKDPEGKNALHTAIQCKGATHIAKRLLVETEKANPYARTTKGGSLLHSFAASRTFMPEDEARHIFHWLTEDLTLDIRAKDNEGRRVFDVADSGSNPGRLILNILADTKKYVEQLHATGFPLADMLDGKRPKPELLQAVRLGLMASFIGHPSAWKGGAADVWTMLETLPDEVLREVDLAPLRRSTVQNTGSAVERYRRRGAGDTPTCT